MTISTHSLINTQVRKIDGLSIRYAESDARDVSAILLSPWPESLFTFEQMWSRLAEHAHLVAIDLPGFGHSSVDDAKDCGIRRNSDCQREGRYRRDSRTPAQYS